MDFWKFMDKFFNEVPHTKYYKNEKEGIEVLEIGDKKIVTKDGETEIINLKKKKELLK